MPWADFSLLCFFFFQAEDGIRDLTVTGVQTCALPIYFRRRFGRGPEGMWLPETAVDPETLDVLAAEGIAFTILAPHQVEQAPADGSAGAHPAPGGRALALGVDDGAISHHVAFGSLPQDAPAWAGRLPAPGQRAGEGRPRGGGGAGAGLAQLVAERLRPGADRAAERRARELLELERTALRMFTSCGWFFDDVAGIETIQILRYAARAIELAGADAPRLEGGVLERLARAQSNEPGEGNGRDVYLHHVKRRGPAAGASRAQAHGGGPGGEGGRAPPPAPPAPEPDPPPPPPPAGTPPAHPAH